MKLVYLDQNHWINLSRAALGKSTHDVERLKPLAAAKAVPQRELDDAISATEVNTASVPYRDAAIRGYCDPCPGNISATSTRSLQKKAQGPRWRTRDP